MNQSSLSLATEKELAQLNELLETYGTTKNIKIGTQLIKEGEKSAFFFFVVKGGFKSFITKGDREYILGFSFKDNIDCCPYSLFSDSQNTYTLEAYADSKIIIVKLSDLEKFTKENADFEDYIQKSLIEYICVVEKTLFDLVSKTAEVRYLDLCKVSQNEIDLISLTDLAKYLGITLERLSRIRKKHGLI
jgi:CRP/FNR family transcriptional regulator, anaerobic regulatory protein